MEAFLIIGLLALVLGAPAAPFAVRKMRAARTERARRDEEERAAEERRQAEERERQEEAARAEADRLRDRAPVIAEGSWIRYTGDVRHGLRHAINTTRLEADRAEERATASEQAHADAEAALPGWLGHSNWQGAVLIAAACAIPVIGVVTFLDYNIFRSTNKFSTAVLYAPSVTLCLVFLGLIFGWAVGWHWRPAEQTALHKYWRGVAAAGAVTALAVLMGWLWHIAPLRSQDKVAAVARAQQSFSAAEQQNAEDKARGRAPTYSNEVIQGFHDKVTQTQDQLDSAAALDRGSVLITSGLELVCVESAMLAESVLNVRRRRREADEAQEDVVAAKTATTDAIANLTATDHQAVHAIFAHLDGLGHPDPAQPVNEGIQNAEQLMTALDVRIRPEAGNAGEGGASQAPPADNDDPDEPPAQNPGQHPGGGTPNDTASTPLFGTVIPGHGAPANGHGSPNGHGQVSRPAARTGQTGAQSLVGTQDRPVVRHVNSRHGGTTLFEPPPDPPAHPNEPPTDVDSLF